MLADGRPIPIDDDVVLPAGVKQLEVRYTATSLAVPSRVLFRYKLEGADAGWVDAGPRRAAFYSNLSGGRYRFQVTATNSDGVLSPRGATLSWRVELQFWETWWFYALGGVGFLFSVFQLSRFRVRRGQARERALRVIVDERTAELSQEIAERRRIEASLRMSRDELEDRVEERTTELRAALAQTQKDMAERRRLEEQLAQVQKLESIGRLAGGVAHDINNVLTVVLSYSDLVDAGLGPSHPLQAQLRQIRKAAERASNLTHRLLAFARKQIVEPRVINLGELSLNLDGMLRRLIGEDVELLTVTSPNLWSVKADPHQIEQVLVNLAVNARDAMPQGGTLRIETTNVVVDEAFARRHPTLKTGEHVRMSVSDTGVGMDEHVMQHMFEPFFTTKEPGKGTGLGLATCYGIVQQLGGAIYPGERAGQGHHLQRLPAAHRPAGRADAAAARDGHPARHRDGAAGRGRAAGARHRQERAVRPGLPGARGRARRGGARRRPRARRRDSARAHRRRHAEDGRARAGRAAAQGPPGDPRALHVRLHRGVDRRAGRRRARHVVPAQAVRAGRDARQGARGARRGARARVRRDARWPTRSRRSTPDGPVTRSS